MDLLHNLWNPSVIWFFAGIILFLLELAFPGFVLFFFGAGAWITAILSLVFGFGLDIQLLVFFISSLLSLAFLRNRLQKLFKGKMKLADSDNDGTLVGEKGTVTNSIVPPNMGKVELHGTNWSAESDSEIPAGTSVEVTAQKNLTLKVKQLK